MAVRRRRGRAAVLGVAVIATALLALVALWQVGTPGSGEPGAAGTIGLSPDRRATLDRIPVRQLTSDRTFWAGATDEEPVFIVSERPVTFEPGAEVTITGKVEAAPAVDVAQRQWGIDESTARALRERGVFLRASRITRDRPQ
jgi:hypothetical protein